MKIALYTRGGKYFTAEHCKSLLSAADSNAIELILGGEVARQFGIKDYLIYEDIESLPIDTDMVISYGGDGTLLGCTAELKGRDIPVLGINSGRLGFLATISYEYVDKILSDISQGKYSIEKRSLIEVSGDFSEPIEFPFALNEFTIQKSGMSMVDVSLSIDGRFVANYMADGLIFSTPTGSTAYSLSAGGSILHPLCENFIISPIAAHNLTMRPLIVPDSSQFSLTVTSIDRRPLASLDNRAYYINSNTRFTLSKADKKISLVKHQGESFFDTIRQKLMWGMDTRIK